MKKIYLTTLITLFLHLSSHAATSDYTYTIFNGKATITDFNSSYSGSLAITNILGACPVTTIGTSAFDSCTNLTSITIPNSVTNIGENAFSYCTSLTNITIPNSVTNIGEYAFLYCTSLTSITIPNSVISQRYQYRVPCVL